MEVQGDVLHAPANVRLTLVLLQRPLLVVLGLGAVLAAVFKTLGERAEEGGVAVEAAVLVLRVVRCCEQCQKCSSISTTGQAYSSCRDPEGQESVSDRLSCGTAERALTVWYWPPERWPATAFEIEGFSATQRMRVMVGDGLAAALER